MNLKRKVQKLVCMLLIHIKKLLFVIRAIFNAHAHEMRLIKCNTNISCNIRLLILLYLFVR